MKDLSHVLSTPEQFFLFSQVLHFIIELAI